MVKYWCERCGKEFSQKSHYDSHNRRKTPCENKSDKIKALVDKAVEEKLKEAYARQFYYLKYGTKDLSSLSATWNSTTTGTNTNTGYFKAGGPLVIGDFATSNFKYAKVGALVKFTSPDKYVVNKAQLKNNKK